MFNRSRLKLACWFALSMGSILTVFTGVVYYFEAEDQLHAFDKALFKKGKAIAARSQYRFQQERWQILLDSEQFLDSQVLPPPYDELVYVRWYATDGQLLKSIGQTIPTQPWPVTSGLQSTFQSINAKQSPDEGTVSGQRLRQAMIPVMQDSVLVGYLEITTPLSPLQDNLNQALLFLALGVPVTLFIIGLTGWFLGGFAMKPIHQSYERLQRFTSDASHELRAPLAAILSNAQVALMPASDETDQQHCLVEIVQSAKVMNGLISNLLFLARQEGPLSPATLGTFQAAELLHPLVESYRELAAQQDRQFISEIPAQTLWLRANANLLRQAIANLLDNAFKYTAAGGIVQLKLMSGSRRVILQIADNGIGIPAADLPHLFERFYRVDTARSRQTGGFGLGLSIAQQIVQAHGGQITVQSVIGRGTTFQIELPHLRR